MEDTEIICTACNTGFMFTASEQAYYAERGFQFPKRCRACRQARRKGRSGPAGSISGSLQAIKPIKARREYPTPCGKCGADHSIPFPPKHDVLCPECFVTAFAS